MATENTAEALRQIKAALTLILAMKGGTSRYEARRDAILLVERSLPGLVEVAECALEYLATNGGKLPRDYRPNGGAETADKLEQALEALGQRHDAAAPEDAGEEG